MGNNSQLKLIETFWNDLLMEFERNESEDILKIIRFVEMEVSRLNDIHFN